MSEPCSGRCSGSKKKGVASDRASIRIGSRPRAGVALRRAQAIRTVCRNCAPAESVRPGSAGTLRHGRLGDRPARMRLRGSQNHVPSSGRHRPGPDRAGHVSDRTGLEQMEEAVEANHGHECLVTALSAVGHHEALPLVVFLYFDAQDRRGNPFNENGWSPHSWSGDWCYDVYVERALRHYAAATSLPPVSHPPAFHEIAKEFGARSRDDLWIYRVGGREFETARTSAGAQVSIRGIITELRRAMIEAGQWSSFVP